MKATCNICSDPFEDNINIMAGKCGHTFHEVCLKTWLRESRSCPTCRQYLTAKNTMRLFLHFTEEDEDKDRLNTSASLHVSEIQDLREELRRVNTDNLHLKDEKQELVQRTKELETASEDWRQKYFEMCNQQEIHKRQLKEVHKLSKDRDKVAEENRFLKRNLEEMKNINLVLNGTKKDVDDMLREVKKSPDALNNFAVHISVLKQQVNVISESRSSLLKELREVRNELVRLETLNKRLEKEVEEHKSYIQVLEQEKHSVTAEPRRTDTSSSVSHHFPTPPPSHESSFSLDITPLNQRTTKKLKLNQVSSLQDHARGKPLQTSQPSWLGQSAKMWNSKVLDRVKSTSEDDDSIIREGYNGLGGHSTFVSRTTTTISFPRPKKLLRK